MCVFGTPFAPQVENTEENYVGGGAKGSVSSFEKAYKGGTGTFEDLAGQLITDFAWNAFGRVIEGAVESAVESATGIDVKRGDFRKEVKKSVEIENIELKRSDILSRMVETKETLLDLVKNDKNKRLANNVGLQEHSFWSLPRRKKIIDIDVLEAKLKKLEAKLLEMQTQFQAQIQVDNP